MKDEMTLNCEKCFLGFCKHRKDDFEKLVLSQSKPIKRINAGENELYNFWEDLGPILAKLPENIEILDLHFNHLGWFLVSEFDDLARCIPEHIKEISFCENHLNALGESIKILSNKGVNKIDLSHNFLNGYELARAFEQVKQKGLLVNLDGCGISLESEKKLFKTLMKKKVILFAVQGQQSYRNMMERYDTYCLKNKKGFNLPPTLLLSENNNASNISSGNHHRC